MVPAPPRAFEMKTLMTVLARAIMPSACLMVLLVPLYYGAPFVQTDRIPLFHSLERVLHNREAAGPSKLPSLLFPDWSAIPSAMLNVSSSDEVGPRWVVVTTINYPTEALKKIVQLDGWKLVVVGDAKTPKDWSLKGAVYLDLDAQAVLGYRIHNLLPLRHYARKNIGYLYAIQHGAEVIYESDDDNVLIQDIDSAFDLRPPPVQMIRYAMSAEGSPKRSSVNPYVHFGQPSMWPRGLALEAIARSAPEQVYIDDPHLRPVIQQGLAEGDPDVDAIFRLTRVSNGKLIRVKFDNKQPPVALPSGLLAPFNSQNTLFHREALWGLLIPITTTFRICDIWRGYWAQRLLWDIGGSLSFYSASVYQERNPHDYYKDYLDELGMYTNTSHLINELLEWRCDNKPHFFDRIISLSYMMATKNFWGSLEVDLVAAWLSDLISVGYIPPTPSNKSSQSAPARLHLSSTSPALSSSFLDGSIIETKVGGQVALQPRNYLLVHSMWERLGGALLAFTQVVTMCQSFHFSFVEPNVYAAEVGALGGYTQKQGPYPLRPLGFYFSSDPIQTYHPMFTTQTAFHKAIGVEQFNEGAHLPLDYLVYINYMNRYPNPDYATAVNFQGIDGVVDCTEHWERMLTTKELHPKLIPSGRVVVAGYSYKKVLCVDRSRPLASTLRSLYDTLPEGRRSIALYEYIRNHEAALKELPNQDLWFKTSNLVNAAGGGLLHEIEAYKEQVLWSTSNYVVLQFRGGSFFRSPDMVLADMNEAMFLARAKSLHSCLGNLTELVNISTSPDMVIHFASDFGNSPEGFENATLVAIVKETFNSAFRSLQSAFGQRLVALQAKRLPSLSLDPDGVTTIVDLKLAIDASDFFFADVTVNGHQGSMYADMIVDARKEKGLKKGEKVVCTYRQSA